MMCAMSEVDTSRALMRFIESNLHELADRAAEREAVRHLVEIREEAPLLALDPDLIEFSDFDV